MTATFNEAHDLLEQVEMLQDDVHDLSYWMADVQGAEQIRLEVAERVERIHGYVRKVLDGYYTASDRVIAHEHGTSVHAHDRCTPGDEHMHHNTLHPAAYNPTNGDRDAWDELLRELERRAT